MVQRITCLSCGKRVEPADYCSRCGTGLDEETQNRVAREHHASSERSRLAQMCDELTEYTASAGERDALARIQNRIEEAPLEEFIDEDNPT